ncbi:MAG: dipicolinate synthase subunit DpsA [Clostridia bacterium]|nr:dipicolinate synthase subunit DpsA [Clostridia bacterium]
MGGKLAGIKIAMLGGDDREAILHKELLHLGAEVEAVGVPGVSAGEDYNCHEALLKAVQGAGAIILPVRGIDQEGLIYAPQSQFPLYITWELAAAIPAGTPVLIGVARPLLKEMAAAHGWQLYETADLDEMAILNAIPTAEGALLLAMQELPITLHGSEAFVIGLGRTGFALARVLDGVGARVTVIDRGAADRARAYREGWQAYPFSDMANIIKQADVIFNTVPALVLTESLLAQTKPEVLIIDLASAPGGTDFEAAAALKRKALLAPGLPGKVAPKTAGLILARIYPTLILNSLQQP